MIFLFSGTTLAYGVVRVGRHSPRCWCAAAGVCWVEKFHPLPPSDHLLRRPRPPSRSPQSVVFVPWYVTMVAYGLVRVRAGYSSRCRLWVVKLQPLPSAHLRRLRSPSLSPQSEVVVVPSYAALVRAGHSRRCVWLQPAPVTLGPSPGAPHHLPVPFYSRPLHELLAFVQHHDPSLLECASLMVPWCLIEGWRLIALSAPLWCEATPPHFQLVCRRFVLPCVTSAMFKLKRAMGWGVGQGRAAASRTHAGALAPTTSKRPWWIVWFSVK